MSLQYQPDNQKHSPDDLDDPDLDHQFQEHPDYRIIDLLEDDYFEYE